MHTLMDTRDAWIQIVEDKLVDGLYKTFVQMSVDAHNYASVHGGKTSDALKQLLKEVKFWNTQVIEDECCTVVTDDDEPSFHDRLKMVFMASSMVLAAVRNKQSSEISVTVPKTTKFIHCVFKLASDEFAKHPELLVSQDNVQAQTYNYEYCQTMLRKCVQRAVRDLMPVDMLLTLDDEKSVSIGGAVYSSVDEEEKPLSEEDEEDAVEEEEEDEDDYSSNQEDDIMFDMYASSKLADVVPEMKNIVTSK